MNIWIVDDSDEDRNSLALSLVVDGHTCTKISGAIEFISMLDRLTEADFVVLDILMPPPDDLDIPEDIRVGQYLFTELRKVDKEKYVVVSSSFDITRQEMSEFYKDSKVLFLSKPIDETELDDAIKEIRYKTKKNMR